MSKNVSKIKTVLSHDEKKNWEVHKSHHCTLPLSYIPQQNWATKPFFNNIFTNGSRRCIWLVRRHGVLRSSWNPHQLVMMQICLQLLQGCLFAFYVCDIVQFTADFHYKRIQRSSPYCDHRLKNRKYLDDVQIRKKRLTRISILEEEFSQNNLACPQHSRSCDSVLFLRRRKRLRQKTPFHLESIDL